MKEKKIAKQHTKINTQWKMIKVLGCIVLFLCDGRRIMWIMCVSPFGPI